MLFAVVPVYFDDFQSKSWKILIKITGRLEERQPRAVPSQLHTKCIERVQRHGETAGHEAASTAA